VSRPMAAPFSSTCRTPASRSPSAAPGHARRGGGRRTENRGQRTVGAAVLSRPGFGVRTRDMRMFTKPRAIEDNCPYLLSVLSPQSSVLRLLSSVRQCAVALVRCQFAPGALGELQAVEGEAVDSGPDEPEGRVADGGGHAAHLAVAALDELE